MMGPRLGRLGGVGRLGRGRSQSRGILGLQSAQNSETRRVGEGKSRAAASRGTMKRV
jgi:hypothetical protein